MVKPDSFYEIAWADFFTGQLEFGDYEDGPYDVRNRSNTLDMDFLPGKEEGDGTWWHQIRFLENGESWADVLEKMEMSNLLVRYGNRYFLLQPLHLTTHRLLAYDERKVRELYGMNLFGGPVDWVTGAEVPRQYFLRERIR